MVEETGLCEGWAHFVTKRYMYVIVCVQAYVNRSVSKFP